MLKFKQMFSGWLEDERGATAIEYGLIAALISIAILVVLGTAGNALTNIFGTIANTLQNAANSAGS